MEQNPLEIWSRVQPCALLASPSTVPDAAGLVGSLKILVLCTALQLLLSQARDPLPQAK